ncbi:MAG TPA: NADH-quinone oxidoreductase subunit L, partial [Ardenticatenaceae bacterium]|nr:NADH-quinone oxidoreductase subunit L [Ardenticatenaceae bacterium]
MLSVALSTLVGWSLFFSTLGRHLGEEPIILTIPWIRTGTRVFDIGFMLDPLAGAMLFMVPFVATLIFIYSVGYHNLGRPNVEPRYSRFFAYVSLFAAGMLALVIADNLLVFFIAWEIMGLCSYLLIGFWFYKPSAMNAARKAFLTTRIGDTLLFSGLMLLYSATGTLTIHEILTAETIEHLGASPLRLGPLFQIPLLPLIALLIFAGAVGKSAQFPLHVWLPDAMEGPTPVSAMIHAATMVAAGVFLVARMLPLFEPLEGSPQLGVVALIGAFTAVFAATIAVAQNDIKRVLAYSTISQLGYMIAALGIGGLIAGVFHMLTHAFFKALLFMGSGSVIHGMEHGVHAAHGHAEHGTTHLTSHGSTDVHAADGTAHTAAAAAHAAPEAHVEVAAHPADEHTPPGHIDPQNMWNMGNLRAHMPRTWLAYLAGTAALAGIPAITSGFWSKDEILAEAWEKFTHGEMGGWLPLLVWILLTAAAGLTAFYMGRQLGLVFFGRERTEAAEHAHESPPTMTIPLMILAVFALVAGFVNIPTNLLPESLGGGWFHHYL